MENVNELVPVGILLKNKIYAKMVLICEAYQIEEDAFIEALIEEFQKTINTK